MASPNDVIVRRQDNQFVAANQSSKIIIAGTVGGVCSVFTAGLVFCLLACRRWVRDKQRIARRRRESSRTRTPPSPGTTVTSSSGYHTTTTTGASLRRTSSPFTADDLSLPSLPPEALWRTTSSHDDLPVPPWWSNIPAAAAVAGKLTTAADSCTARASRIPVDIAPFVSTPYFGATRTHDCSGAVRQHQQILVPDNSTDFSFFNGTNAQRSSTEDEFRGHDRSAANQTRGRKSDHRRSARLSTNSQPITAPAGDHMTVCRHTDNRLQESTARTDVAAAGHHHRRPVEQWISTVWNGRSRATTSHRKHSDSGLQQQQRRANVMTTLPPDRNTWELVNCMQLELRVIDDDLRRPPNRTGVIVGPRDPGFDAAMLADRVDFEEEIDSSEPVWVRRMPDSNYVGTGAVQSRINGRGHPAADFGPYDINTVPRQQIKNFGGGNHNGYHQQHSRSTRS